MPIINVQLYTEHRVGLQAAVAGIVQRNAAEYLHFDPAQTVVSARFAAPDDKWFFNLVELDRKHYPAFHVHATIGNGTATDLDAVAFVGECLRSIESLLANQFPGSVAPGVPDRNKVTVVAMP